MKKIVKYVGIIVGIILLLILIYDFIIIIFKPNIGCCSCCGPEEDICITSCCSCAKPIILQYFIK